MSGTESSKARALGVCRTSAVKRRLGRSLKRVVCAT